MAGTATFNEVTLKEIEWRSHAIMADASQAIVRIARQKSQLTLLRYQIFIGIRSMNSQMRDLVALFHSSESIQALEAATPEQLSNITDNMVDVRLKVSETVARIRSTRLGYWERLYSPHLNKLEDRNHELDYHVQAFVSHDSEVMLLTKRDQDCIVESLLNPPEPNAALRRAFSRK